jgi:hypothetical protein
VCSQPACQQCRRADSRFNGNGRTDLAPVRQTPGCGSIPIAFANGDGTWTIANRGAPEFAEWAHQPGVRVVAGDFDRNGRTDLALVRQTPGWGSIPVAFANGDGTWTITNGAAPQFVADWAHEPGIRVVGAAPPFAVSAVSPPSRQGDRARPASMNS